MRFIKSKCMHQLMKSSRKIYKLSLTSLQVLVRSKLTKKKIK